MSGTRRWAHPARRDGLIALVLFVLPLLYGIVSRQRDHHLDGGTLAVLISVAVGLPTLWLTWATYREGRRAAAVGEVSLPDVADSLAGAIRVQWEAESELRRLNDPYPLPVSWRAADPEFAEDWEVLVRLASSGAGWPSPAPDRWAAEPGELAGTGNQLIEVLDKVPTRRLVVLGEPGAGKTMLLVRLVLDLIARRAHGDPVPVLLPMLSWDPATENLGTWLAGQLQKDNSLLAASAPSMNGAARTLAEALLDAGLIVPVLDGLDEMPSGIRTPAIGQVNGIVRPGTAVIVSCRIEEYRQAARGTKLHGGAVIALEPLGVDVVRDYLRDDSRSDNVSARWTPVFALLGTQAPAGLALTTPLMVNLARTIYNPRAGEDPRDLPHPAELCEPGMTARTVVERHLFDAFVPAAYRDSTQPGRAAAAEKWLISLAGRLRTLNIAPWRRFPNLRAVMVESDPWSAAISQRRGRIGRAVLLARVLAAGAGCAFLGYLAGGYSVLHANIPVSILVGLLPFAVPVTALRVRTRRTELDLWTEATTYVTEELTEEEFVSAAVSPRADLALVRVATLWSVAGLTGPLLVIAGVGPLLGYGAGRLAGVIAGAVIGMTAGAVVAPWAASAQTDWTTYLAGRLRLALRGELPWRLMAFLEDAHQRGVLRQAGAVYQFRHAELHRRLAARAQAGQADENAVAVAGSRSA